MQRPPVSGGAVAAGRCPHRVSQVYERWDAHTVDLIKNNMSSSNMLSIKLHYGIFLCKKKERMFEQNAGLYMHWVPLLNV